jgi:hypothetical protein
VRRTRVTAGYLRIAICRQRRRRGKEGEDEPGLVNLAGLKLNLDDLAALNTEACLSLSTCRRLEFTHRVVKVRAYNKALALAVRTVVDGNDVAGLGVARSTNDVIAAGNRED